MDQGLREFAERHRRVREKHRRLSHGYVTRVNSNGVIEHFPKREMKSSLVTPVAILVAALFGFKMLVLAQLGEDAYGRHLDTLAQGNVAERFGAVVMTPDPLTRAVVDALVPPL